MNEWMDEWMEDERTSEIHWWHLQDSTG